MAKITYKDFREKAFQKIVELVDLIKETGEWKIGYVENSEKYVCIKTNYKAVTYSGYFVILRNGENYWKFVVEEQDNNMEIYVDTVIFSAYDVTLYLEENLVLLDKLINTIKEYLGKNERKNNRKN